MVHPAQVPRQLVGVTIVTLSIFVVMVHPAQVPRRLVSSVLSIIDKTGRNGTSGASTTPTGIVVPIGAKL